MLYLSIITPIIAAFYIVWQIQKRDLRGWQHYACLTSLIFLISVLFLASSGQVESFGVAGNSVKLVDQKLDEIRALTERNKAMAQGTIRFVQTATSRLLAAENYDDAAVNKTAAELLKSAGFSDSEIAKLLSDELK